MGRARNKERKNRRSPEVARMNPEEFSSKIIDICAEMEVVEDYDLEFTKML